MSKNHIYAKVRIFTSTKKRLDIFENSFKQIKAMDYIYNLFKLEIVLIDVLQRRGKRVEASQNAYITRAGST
jgi:hypothetical protein